MLRYVILNFLEGIFFKNSPRTSEANGQNSSGSLVVLAKTLKVMKISGQTF